MTRFDVRSTAQGITRDGYTEGRDSTHLAIPLAIDGAASADEADNRATAAAKVLSNVVDGLPGVRWCRDPLEAVYALLANVTTALATLSAQDRAHVLALAPGLADLRELTRLWVVEAPSGALFVAPGPGSYAVPGPEGAGLQLADRRPAREATVEDLRRLA